MSWEAGSLPDPEHRSILRRRDEVLRVNGRPFRGVSMYLRELLNAEHQPPPAPPNFEWHPFALTTRFSGGTLHHVEVGFPHCTCGIPNMFESVAAWVVPPIFCVILGFATVCLRPRAMLAWAFLGLMLSLSQVQFWLDWYSGFQLTSTPMIWTGWFRVPAVGYRALVQHAWPAALLAASTHFYRSRRRLYSLAMGISALFLVRAVLEAVLQIAWSEDYRSFVFLHQFLGDYRTELIVASVAAVASLAWLLSRRFGLAIVAEGLLAVVALYWSATPITKGEWYDYSDNTRRFVASVPDFHNTSSLITMLFVAGVLATALLVFKRGITVPEALGFLLCVPLGGDLAARWGAHWYPFASGPFQYWP